MSAVVATATPAVAHTALEDSSPNDGAKVRTAPDQIVLDFTGPIRPRLSKVTVRGPGGDRFEVGTPQVTTDKVTQSLRPLGESGMYRITYRVVASDGHPLGGTLQFTLTLPRPEVSESPAIAAAPPSQAPARAASSSSSDRTADGGGVPLWLLTIGAVGAVAALTGAVWFGRRVTRDID